MQTWDDVVKEAFAQERKRILAEKGKENLKLSEGRGNKKPLSDSDKPFTPHDTRAEIAKETGVSAAKDCHL